MQVRDMAGRRLGMRHCDVQLFGDRVTLKGMIAEMETGEGKAMIATWPARAAALAGIPVHNVTVNDFQVGRDADWIRPIHEAFGLTVGTMLEGIGPRRASPRLYLRRHVLQQQAAGVRSPQ